MTQLPTIPQALPKTQPDWERFFNVMQGWQRGIQTHKWQAPTLQNGWVYYGAPYELPGYYMDAAGVVHLRGLVKNGTVGNTTPIFTLPASYRPAYTQIRPAISNDVFCEIRVGAVADPNTAPGAVVAYSGGGPWVSLSGIAFDTTP